MTRPGLLRRIWDRSWAAAQAISQAVILPVGLFVLYFAGLGSTWVLSKVFHARILRDPDPESKTFWTAAEGYEPDQEDCLRQS
jgi:hypothetical protein